MSQMMRAVLFGAQETFFSMGWPAESRERSFNCSGDSAASAWKEVNATRKKQRGWVFILISCGGNGLFKRGVFEEFVGPGEEEFHVGTIFMAAIVLSPGELAIEQADVDGRHFGGAVILLDAEVTRAEKPEDRTGSD